ncbi:hypothetical protein INF27_01600 [Bifidobacterium saeculare]|nr:hypothetical protein [Bifidobacterium pullorum]MBE5064730.1 hypothetical protein [Bifidobacterium pullorum subsp. saeculare]
MAYFMCNSLSKVSRKHMTWASGALKVVFAMENRQAALKRSDRSPHRRNPEG